MCIYLTTSSHYLRATARDANIIINTDDTFNNDINFNLH